MTDGVIYLFIGLKHASHFIVSLMSLRDHYQGPVAIMADPADPGWDFLQQRVLTDRRTGDLRLVEVAYTPKRKSGKSGGHYFAKCSMGELSPFDRTVFIDLDTLIVGDFSKLYPNPEYVSLTSFANWTTQTGRMPSRIKNWSEYEPVRSALQLSVKYPAINTGVIGFSKTSHRFMSCWKEVTAKNISFICDEIACQLMFVEFPHVVYSERYNASPKFSPNWDGPVKKHGAIIWHGHGFKFLKREDGWRIWLPHYFRALDENYCGIKDWMTDKQFTKQPRKYIELYSRQYGWLPPLDCASQEIKSLVEGWLCTANTASS